MFCINRKYDYNRRKKAFWFSLMIPGFGQLMNGRKSGIFFPIIILFSLLFLFHMKKPEVFSNGLIAAGYVIIYLLNLIDAAMGPYIRKSPCQLACPAKINVSDYIALIADRRYEEAKALIKLRMPFVSVCGTICSHPCETKCVRSGYDSAVMIMNIKKPVSDYNESINDYFKGNTSKRVSIIGSGPSGLSIAYFLSRKNIHVTIYEKEKEAGGLLRYGIPRFRIDSLDIYKDISSILESEYIEMKTDIDVGRDILLDEIRKESDLTVIAAGNNMYHCPHSEIVPDNYVYPGLDILRRISKNETVIIGKRVCIVGGGNVAMDVARTAIRMGAAAEIVYRGQRTGIKATECELRDAEDEGVILRYGAEIVSIDEKNDMLHVKLKDEEGNEYEEGFNSIIYATGQYLDTAVIDPMLKGENEKSNMSDVLIAVDKGTVVESIANARLLSQNIIRRFYGLKGILANIYDNIDYIPKIRSISDAHWNYSLPKHQNRIDTLVLNPQKRKNTFFKVKRDLNIEEATSQAKRCFRCNK